MLLYLTSHIGGSYKVGMRRFPAPLMEDNELLDSLKAHWKEEAAVLLIASAPEDFEKNDGLHACFAAAFPMSGLSLGHIDTCDARTEELVEHLQEYDAVILCGGHVPTQNAFFRKIGLKEKLAGYAGIVIGISAGTMNCADVVYAQPELPGEAVDAGYQRFLTGLGLTEVMVLPHWQALRGEELDGLRIFEDITLPDSTGRVIYALNDGSYILSEGGVETLYGEAYRIEDGVMEKICDNGQCVVL